MTIHTVGSIWKGDDMKQTIDVLKGILYNVEQFSFLPKPEREALHTAIKALEDYDKLKAQKEEIVKEWEEMKAERDEARALVDKLTDNELDGEKSKLKTLLDKITEERIAKILAEDEGLGDEAWADIMKATKHFGDCTNEPETCFVCLREMYFTTARAIVKSLLDGRFVMDDKTTRVGTTPPKIKLDIVKEE